MPEPGARTLLGFDYGMRKVGIAVGQELTGTSTPLITLRHRRDGPDWDGIGALIEKWRPAALVVGVPLNMDDTEQPMTLAARRFANRLAGRFHLPVHEADERLSTRSAASLVRAGGPGRARPRHGLDEVAAHVILQTFLSQTRVREAT